MIELELFVDVHPVPGGVDPNPNAERQRICRVCASEVLLYNLRDWWVRERKKGFLEEHVMARPDCPDGSQCSRQKNHSEYLPGVPLSTLNSCFAPRVLQFTQKNVSLS